MRKFVCSSFVLLALAACGGGGSTATGDVQGLQAPEQVSIVDSETSGSGSLRLPAGLRAIAGSDYETDRTRFWIRDDSMQALDTVNMILNSLQQTRYWEQTNAGAYRALIEQDDRGGGERGNTGKSYEEWVVDSTRASNSAPQIVSFWVSTEESMGQTIPAIIYGKLTVTEEPSDGPPLGQFTLTFQNLPASESATSTATMFEGYLRTVARTDGQSEVEFFMSHGDVGGSLSVGDVAMRERCHVIGNPSTDSGRAYAEKAFAMNTGSGTQTDNAEYQLQFNSNYVARREVSNGNALTVLDRNDYETRVFRYGLYDNTTEDRVETQSGFPVEDANGRYGWAGFEGIWFPDNVTLTNGQTIYRRNHQDNSTTPYSIVIAAGKLMKRTRASITLGDIVNEELEYFSPNGGGEQKVMYTGSDFVRTASRVNGEWQLENTPVSVAGNFTTGQWCNFWSQARGSVEFTWPASLANNVAAFVWSNTTVTADSPELANGDLTLNGYFHMLRANITSDQANFTNSESPYLPDASSTSSGNQTYVFDRDTMLLTLGGNPVTLGSGVTITQGPGMWGLNCGPMFSTALGSFNDIPNQTTSYEWSIGTNPWNQLRTLKDANDDFVQFDPPIRMTYVHDEDGSAFDGRTFFLEFDGTSLRGIPHEQVGETGMWYPLFNIPTGTTLTAGSATYKVKQLEGEQFMVAVGSPSTVYAAQGFDIDGTPITAPDDSGYADPAIGARPSITAAPLYVGGVAQTSDN
ncbi:MAG: hypothetical protein JNK15_10435 [Planctomycetes bacterium]|nr:hypothetical protein [Planctomycetota bacterium]